jgi:hypothetical protein
MTMVMAMIKMTMAMMKRWQTKAMIVAKQTRLDQNETAASESERVGRWIRLRSQDDD